MAALTKEEKKLKMTALHSEFTKLKNDSIGSKNHASQEAVVDAANSSEASIYFTSPISYSSLKQPKSLEMKELKDEIDFFKIEHKRRKNALSNKNKEKFDELNLIISNDTSDKALLCFLIETLETKVEQKDKRIDGLKEELDKAYSKLNER